MRTLSLLAIPLLIPVVAMAQTSPPRSAILPPNAIDRANAATDQRRAEAARAAEADRARAERDFRASAATRTGPVAGSTMTDGQAGLGTRPDLSRPPQ